MRIAATGRFVFVAQWPAAVVLPLFFLFGRVLVGSEMGFMIVFGIVLAPLAIAVLLVPPALTRFDDDSRRVRATRLGYDVASFVLWAAGALAAVAFEDSLGFAGARSALTAWFGLSSSETGAVFGLAVTTAVASYAAVLVLAIAGIARGRDMATTDAEASA